MAKPYLYINTIHGAFKRQTYKGYTCASVWIEPNTGDHVVGWHLHPANVEKHEFAPKCQLLGIYKVKYVEDDTLSEQIPYLV
jgi:hypothetical protein